MALFDSLHAKCGTRTGKILILLAIGLGFRLLFACQFLPVATDSREFNVLATNLVSGNGYTLYPGETINYYRWPFYPVFLSLCYKLSGIRNFTAVISVQIAIDLILIYFMFSLMAQMFGSEKKAFLGALIYAAFPHIARYSTWIMSEFMCISLLTGVTLLFFKFRSNLVLSGITSGTFLGFLFLTKPRMGIYLAFIIFFYPIFERKLKRILGFSVLVTLFFMLTTGTWYGYQYLVTGKIRLIPLPIYTREEDVEKLNKLHNWSEWIKSWIDQVRYQDFYWCLPMDIEVYPDSCFESETEKKQFAAYLCLEQEKFPGSRYILYGTVSSEFLENIGRMAAEKLKKQRVVKYFRYAKIAFQSLFYTDYIALFRTKFYSHSWTYLKWNPVSYFITLYAEIFKILLMLFSLTGIILFVKDIKNTPNASFFSYCLMVFLVQIMVLSVFNTFIPRYTEVVLHFLIPFAVIGMAWTSRQLNNALTAGKKNFMIVRSHPSMM